MERIRNWAFEVGVVKTQTRQPDKEGLQMVELYHIKVLSLIGRYCAILQRTSSS